LTQSSYFEFLSGYKKSPPLIALANENEARKCEECALFFGFETFVLPDFRAYYLDDLRSYKEELQEINISLHSFFASDKKKLLISPYKTILHKLPKKEFLTPIELKFADSYKIDELKKRLFCYGYRLSDVTEGKGEVSFRGDIVDIFPINAQDPYRLSFFGDEIESIRRFDVSTQMSAKEEIESILVHPSFLALSEDRLESLSKEAASLECGVLVKDVESLGFWLLGDMGEFLYEKYPSFIASDVLKEIEEEGGSSPFGDHTLIEEAKIWKDFVLAGDVTSLIKTHKDKKITLIASNEAVLKQYGLEEYKELALYANRVINLLSPKELIISLNKSFKKRKQKAVTLAIDELKIGDFVVHERYGVAVFKGVVKREIGGGVREFVELAYQGEDRLLVPVDGLDVLSRYVASSGLLPSIDRLGKGSFAKLKDKIKDKLFEIAGEIIEISAKRELVEGIKIEVTMPELELFKNSSGFTYTNDQQRAIEEIFSDLTSSKVMDRVLSGDVGFGKTEVAMNAVFAVVKSGYQCAFIAPTKILSNQHFRTFKDRLLPFGVRIAKLDNSMKSNEKNNVLASLKEGTLDIVVGTHGLLNAEFKRLGLVIVDEEHKFGVKQKERIKSMSCDVHMLSMSATPIPRTLNQALSSIKGMSSITTPPKERVGVKTFVREYSDTVVKEAVKRELRRGGQLFFIYNNIATIENKKLELERINDGIKIATLHSKVTPEKTEEIMAEFEEGRYDLLLSTSIIESGIHLPSVNSIIVQNADRFGIADLHQLRGRVGRGNKEGFCYLLVDDKEELTSEAQKRLLALESNSFLGSGYNLAYYDLEIRGGGNILGEAQSGHIKHVGYALYLKMLEDAINKLSGKDMGNKKELELNLNITAFLSEYLINEDRLRLDLYRRLSRCVGVSEVYKIEEEIIDRFGKLDESSAKFIEMMAIKVLAKSAGVSKITNYQQNITLEREGQKEVLKAPSKDDDDILKTLSTYLRKLL